MKTKVFTTPTADQSTKQALKKVLVSDKATQGQLAIGKAMAILDTYYYKNRLSENELSAGDLTYIQASHHSNQMLFSAALDYIKEAKEVMDTLAIVADSEDMGA